MKLQKVVIKSVGLTVLVIPIYGILKFSTFGNAIDNWEILLFISSILSFGFIFYQVFEYENLNVTPVDFLESKHSRKVNFISEDECFTAFVRFHQYFFMTNEIEKTDDCLTVRLKTFFKTVITIQKSSVTLDIQISNKILPFLPDRCANYIIINKITEQLSNIKNRT